MLELETGTLASAAALAGGMILGLAARLGRFCIMGALEDAVYGNELGRLRMVAMAAAVAVAGTSVATLGGAFDPADSFYLATEWSPVGAVLGGLLFGLGMAFVGTCGFGALARLGGGDIRSLLMVMVMGVAAYAMMTGPLAWLRLLIVPEGIDSVSLAELAGKATGLPATAISLAAALSLAAFAMSGGGARKRLFWGGAVGLTIPFAWVVTSWASTAGFDIVVVRSFSFVTPLGESIVEAMTNHGLDVPDFGVASVIGVVVGAALGTAWTGDFRWEACDDARELRRQIAGAGLMGIGGILALGCTIGQGLSALSVLAPSAPVVIVSIMVGARLGLYLLVEGLPLRRAARRR